MHWQFKWFTFPDALVCFFGAFHTGWCCGALLCFLLKYWHAVQVSLKLTLANSIFYCTWATGDSYKWTSTVHHTNEVISMYSARRMAPQQMAILWQVCALHDLDVSACHHHLLHPHLYIHLQSLIFSCQQARGKIKWRGLTNAHACVRSPNP